MLIERFEDGSLPPQELNHRAHIRLAWSYLRALPLFQALSQLTSGLQRFTKQHGQADKYHQTVTLAYSLAVYERLRSLPADASWESFEAENPALFEPSLGLMARYYDAKTLHSDTARAYFLLPDQSTRAKRSSS